MAGLGPDLPNCFDYLGATKKSDDPCNSSNMCKMQANFKLYVIRMSQRP